MPSEFGTFGYTHQFADLFIAGENSPYSVMGALTSIHTHVLCWVSSSTPLIYLPPFLPHHTYTSPSLTPAYPPSRRVACGPPPRRVPPPADAAHVVRPAHLQPVRPTLRRFNTNIQIQFDFAVFLISFQNRVFEVRGSRVSYRGNLFVALYI